ncbi:MAG: signal peptidase II [Acidiferrobacteraceae bacterium]
MIRRWLWLAVVVTVLDQWSKWEVVRHLARPVRLAPVLNLVLTYNRGAAFGFLSTESGWQNMLFMGIAIVISGVILVTLRGLTRGQDGLAAGLALVLGGALGNLADRIRLGKVVDFIDFHIGSWHWYTFNLADSAITLGAFLLVLDALGVFNGGGGS